MRKLFTTIAMSGAFLAVTFSAQAGKIGQRKENQQDRIAQGVKSGQLTAHETAHLENKEANLNKEIRNDRKDNNGNLTDAEKQKINQQQNKLSGKIYDKKHNNKAQ